MRQCCPAEARERLDAWIDQEFAGRWQPGISSTDPGFLTQLDRPHRCDYALRQDRAEAVADHVDYDGPVTGMDYPVAAHVLLTEIKEGRDSAEKELRALLDPSDISPIPPGGEYPR